MDQLMDVVSHDQEVDFLYSLIRKDPDFLSIYQKQFVDTPLHFAAAEGRTQLALEIQRLMSSFGTKLNPDGFSPLDLALRRGHTKTVSSMIKLNPELIRVQGREGFTPLHYVAQMDDVDMLAEFLLTCPDSIEELTINGESAAHVAVKSGNLESFKVLVGWLRRIGDYNGDTVLHLAAYTNQPKVMKLMKNYVSVNDKNTKGLTALDIVLELPPQVKGEALKFLQWRLAKRGSALKFSTVANYLSSPIKTFEEAIKFDANVDMVLSGDMRNAILVVAVLIATAIYQTGLSPPGGLNDSTPVILNMSASSNTTSLTTTIIKDTNTTVLDGLQVELGSSDDDGTVSMGRGSFVGFIYFNVIALTMSVGMIFLVLPTRLYNICLYVSLVFLMFSYTTSIYITMPALPRPEGDVHLVLHVCALLNFHSGYSGEMLFTKAEG